MSGGESIWAEHDRAAVKALRRQQAREDHSIYQRCGGTDDWDTWWEANRSDYDHADDNKGTDPL